jgi:hypothetical protein
MKIMTGAKTKLLKPAAGTELKTQLVKTKAAVTPAAGRQWHPRHCHINKLKPHSGNE